MMRLGKKPPEKKPRVRGNRAANRKKSFAKGGKPTGVASRDASRKRGKEEKTGKEVLYHEKLEGAKAAILGKLKTGGSSVKQQAEKREEEMKRTLRVAVVRDFGGGSRAADSEGGE